MRTSWREKIAPLRIKVSLTGIPRNPWLPKESRRTGNLPRRSKKKKRKLRRGRRNYKYLISMSMSSRLITSCFLTTILSLLIMKLLKCSSFTVLTTKMKRETRTPFSKLSSRTKPRNK
jgi:hypothetical protein